MYARAVDDAAIRLRKLRHAEREDLGLAAIVFALAVSATELRPSLALPLFFGGLGVGVLGVRALWRRWDLVDRLSGERDAFTIPEVLAYASRETTLERRQSLAAMIRDRLSQAGAATRLGVADGELEALASELEDTALQLDPAAAVACTRLLRDLDGGPLPDSALPPAELRSRVRQIRCGFTRSEREAFRPRPLPGAGRRGRAGRRA